MNWNEDEHKKIKDCKCKVENEDEYMKKLLYFLRWRALMISAYDSDER